MKRKNTHINSFLTKDVSVSEKFSLGPQVYLFFFYNLYFKSKRTYMIRMIKNAL